MCGRIVIPDRQTISKQMSLLARGDDPFERNINGAPTNKIPVIIDDSINAFDYYFWSLIPSFSQTGKPDFKYPTINAKVENLKSSPTWRRLIGKRHCIVITEGFYEWNYDDPIKKKGSHPNLLRTRGEQFTFMAGLWDTWRNPLTQVDLHSCTIITQPANEMMASIHNTKARMPAILTPDTYNLWLDPELPVEERLSVIAPYENDFLQAVEIKKVGDLQEYESIAFC